MLDNIIMTAVIAGVVAVVSFFLGIMTRKSREQAHVLKSISKTAKEYEKINLEAQKDTRSDEDVLKKY